MKKKLLALVLLLVLAFGVVAPGVASACSYNSELARYNQAVSIINSANSKIRSLVRTAQATPYNDVAWLIASTNSVAANAKYKVSRLGFKVGCTYTYYKVDGRTVAIDPLYVINPRPTTGDGR